MSLVQTVRGAALVEANTASAIDDATCALCTALLAENRLTSDQILSALFSLTAELDAQVSAASARRLGWGGMPLFCAQDLEAPGGPSGLIRILLHVRLKRARRLRPVYLGRAAALLPDLSFLELAG